MKRLIIGCGYLGRRVADAWRERGEDVCVLTRSATRAREFAEAGFRPIVGDVMDAESLRTMPAADTILYAVGYDRSTRPSKREVYVSGLRNVMTALPASCGRLIYVSSTSVYGQSEGEWVDESSPCRPGSNGGRICHDAEQVARSAFPGTGGVTVLRLSGIYGPGRLAARVEALRRGQPIAGNPEGWLNLIHVDDARFSVIAGADRDDCIETLVVSDDQPLKRSEYYRLLARTIQAPPPTYARQTDPDLGKRCSNRRLKESLGVPLLYPTIAEGLPSAVG